MLRCSWWAAACCWIGGSPCWTHQGRVERRAPSGGVLPPVSWSPIASGRLIGRTFIVSGPSASPRDRCRPRGQQAIFLERRVARERWPATCFTAIYSAPSRRVFPASPSFHPSRSVQGTGCIIHRTCVSPTSSRGFAISCFLVGLMSSLPNDMR